MGLRFETLRRVRGLNETWWRYGASGLAAWSYLLGSSAVEAEALDIIDQLVTNGVAISHVDRLFSDPEAFDRLRERVDQLVSTHETEIARARLGNGQFRQVSLIGDHPTLEATDDLVAFLMSPAMADIAALFYRMPARLLECKVWHSVAGGDEPVTTQRWHRDRPGDVHMLKCFVYLNDIAEASGPFCFLSGTHRGGSVTPAVPSTLDGKVERFPEDVASGLDVRRCTGTAGTVVFADTTGIHMGGRSTIGDRIVVAAHYGSAAAWQRPYYRVDRPVGDRGIRYALGHDRPPRTRHMRSGRIVSPDGAAS